MKQKQKGSGLLAILIVLFFAGYFWMIHTSSQERYAKEDAEQWNLKGCWVYLDNGVQKKAQFEYPYWLKPEGKLWIVEQFSTSLPDKLITPYPTCKGK